MSGEVRLLQEAVFERDFIKKTADEFQDFFSEIMEKRYPTDFIRVRPWGKVGDRKNDGYLTSTRTLFQVYAPNELSSADCIKKINDDFTGALPHWRQHFDTWVFVHNSRKEGGLGPDVTKTILELSTKQPGVVVQSWGFAELRKLSFELPPADLCALLHLPATDEACLDWPCLCTQYIKSVIARGTAFFERKLLRDPDGTENERDLLPHFQRRTASHSVPRGVKTPPAVRIDEIAKAEPRTLLLGGYGTGKSFLLRSIFLASCKSRLIESTGSIPVYLDISAFPYADVPRMICTEITRALNIPPAKDAGALLNANVLLLLVDGLEELPAIDQKQVAQDLLTIVHQHPAIRVIVAARPSWHGITSLGQGFVHYEVQPLTNIQGERRLAELCPTVNWRFLPGKVCELCGTPIHLEMIAEEAARGAENISDSPSGLFDRFLEHRFEQIQQSQEFCSIPSFVFRAAASALAVSCINRSSRALPHHEVFKVLDALQEMLGQETSKVLQGLQRVSILSGTDAGGLISFGHMAFRDYLGALHLASLLKVGKSVGAMLQESPEWFEAVVFAAGALDDFDLQSALLESIWTTNRFAFFSALNNRYSSLGVERVVDESLTKKLMVRLAQNYSTLVADVAFPARGAFDPFVFQAEHLPAVSVTADISNDFSIVNYRYHGDSSTRANVHLAKLGPATLDGVQADGMLRSYQLSYQNATHRHVNLAACSKDMFSVYEMARDDFSQELFGLLKDHQFLCFTPDIAYEYIVSIRKSLPPEIRRLGENSLIQLEDYLDYALANVQGREVLLVEYPRVSLHVFAHAVAVSRSSYERIADPLVMGKDISPEDMTGGMIWDAYSPSRVMSIIQTAVPIILDNYRQVVDKYFPGYASSLPLRVAMPVRLCAQVFRFESPNDWCDGEYMWRWSLLPIGGNTNEVQVCFFANEPSFPYFNEDLERVLQELGRDSRIAGDAVGGSSSGIFEIGNEDAIIQKTVFSLIIQDFARLFKTTGHFGKVYNSLL